MRRFVSFWLTTTQEAETTRSPSLDYAWRWRCSTPLIHLLSLQSIDQWAVPNNAPAPECRVGGGNNETGMRSGWGNKSPQLHFAISYSSLLAKNWPRKWDKLAILGCAATVNVFYDFLNKYCYRLLPNKSAFLIREFKTNKRETALWCSFSPASETGFQSVWTGVDCNLEGLIKCHCRWGWPLRFFTLCFQLHVSPL